MSKSNVIGPEGRETIADPVTELLRVGAQQLIQHAVEAELEELQAQHCDRRTETVHGICFRISNCDPIDATCSRATRFFLVSSISQPMFTQ